MNPDMLDIKIAQETGRVHAGLGLSLKIAAGPKGRKD